MVRRQFIKNTTLGATALSLSPFWSFNILKRNSIKEEDILGHGDYQYKLHRDWAKLSSVQTPLLNCHEMVMDRKGRLIMLGDHPQNNILIFDKSGKLLDSWGTAYPGGHGLTLSKEGEEDFLFLTDAGWYLNKQGKWIHHNGRVTKTKTDGQVIFDIGHPQTIGIYKPGDLFCPTETAISPNGDIYVADGYGSDYIIQYNAKGQYIRHFGGHQNEDPRYNLKNAHGVAIDERGNETLVVVTSRTENCFKFFTLAGKFVKQVDLPGLFVCRPVIDGPNIYAGVCWSKTRGDNKGWVRDTGFITILEGDRVVSNPGGTAPKYNDQGILQQMYQSETPIFNHGHDVCVDKDQNLYVCQWNAGHTPPIKLERV